MPHQVPRPTGRPVEDLSETAAVRMADDWWDIYSPDHFWFRRRMEVLLKLAGPLLAAGTRVADIGCGNGMVQRQLEESLELTIDGFDLNRFALERSVSRRGRVAYYNVFDRREDLRGRYDTALALDVVEHVEDQDAFLLGIRHMLTPGGFLVLNVPAGQALYSTYDEAAGHVRRYAPDDVAMIARRAGFALERWTYWGLPLVPLVIMRKWFMRDPRGVVERGFRPLGSLSNRVLLALSRLEPIPQRLFGTSLLAVLRHAPSPTSPAGAAHSM